MKPVEAMTLDELHEAHISAVMDIAYATKCIKDSEREINIATILLGLVDEEFGKRESTLTLVKD